MKLNILILKDVYAIYRLEPDATVPADVYNSGFYSIIKTPHELSIICKQYDHLLQESPVNKDWRILVVQGPLDFSLVGIMAEISGILAKANISIFTLSTYNTDYILVKNNDIQRAIDSLKTDGHALTFENS